MRLIPTLLFLTFGLSAVLAQEPKAGAPAPMTEEVRKMLLEARDMRVKQRYADALEKLDAIEKLAPNLADLYALRGDIYLAPRRRDFDMALQQFEKAAQLQPGSPLPQFNLAEFYFVKHDFAIALERFTKLTTDFPKLPMVIRHLVHYRRTLCELKLGHRPAAEQIIADNFTFMDDTPAYYFSKAALGFDSGNQASATDWIKRGLQAFKPGDCEAYYDAFKELRWVPDLDFAPEGAAPKKP